MNTNTANKSVNCSCGEVLVRHDGGVPRRRNVSIDSDNALAFIQCPKCKGHTKIAFGLCVEPPQPEAQAKKSRGVKIVYIPHA